MHGNVKEKLTRHEKEKSSKKCLLSQVATIIVISDNNDINYYHHYYYYNFMQKSEVIGCFLCCSRAGQVQACYGFYNGA